MLTGGFHTNPKKWMRGWVGWWQTSAEAGIPKQQTKATRKRQLNQILK
jgi:hypothetical protein